MQFVREFNEKTGKMEEGMVIPVIITVFKDKTFNFILKTPPASYLLKKAAGIAKGSGAPNKDKVGKVTRKQIEDIAKFKLPDLNANDVEAAARDHRGHRQEHGIGDHQWLNEERST